MTTPAIIRQRRDTAANWVSQNPVLHDGQMGFETDTGLFKLGDGASAWNTLIYPYGQVMLALSCSGLQASLSAISPAAYVMAPRGFELLAVRASLHEPSTALAVEIEVTKNGTSVFTTNLTIDVLETDSADAAVPAVLDVAQVQVANGDFLVVNILGGGTDAKGLVVYFYGYAT